MSFLIRKRLLFLAPLMTNALPQSSSTSIPQLLQNSVPKCAWNCLSSFIQDNFPKSICSNPEDVDCLCSHEGVEGYTLGEGAFVCAHQNCPSESESKINSTYTICSSQPNAVKPTNSLLPVTFTTLQSGAPSTQTSMITPTAVPSASPTVDPTTMTTSATPVSAPKHGLQMSQIVAISVACGAVVIISIGIAAILTFLRRRRRRLKLGSEPLPSAEFKPPPQANAQARPERTGLGLAIKDPRSGRDPRGGAGGVGLAPVRYKAILPPANLFSVQQYPQRPDDFGASLGTPAMGSTVVADSRQQAAPVTLAQSTRDERAAVHHAPMPHSAVPSVAASSHYSTDRALPSASVRHESMQKPEPIQRHPSLLLPAKPDMALLAQDRPYSVASQMTQFEEDVQSPTVPAGISNMSIFPIATSSSECTTDSSQGGTSSSKSPPASPPISPNRKSRGPSLRISIPGQPTSRPPGPLVIPPPPPRPAATDKSKQRPTLAKAGATGLPYSSPSKNAPGTQRGRPSLVDPAVQLAFPPPPPRTKQQKSSVQVGTQGGVKVYINPSSPPLQFPVPPSGKVVAVAAPAKVQHDRKDSISRRGFSQPNTAAFQSAQRSATSPRGNMGPLTVNGERINYPSVPRPSASPTASFQMPSPPAFFPMPSPPASFPLPPPPPIRPPAAASGIESNRSSQDTSFSNVSYGSASNSLLAKRRGSERAAALERQLYINKSNFRGSGNQAESNALTGSPKVFRGAGHGRTDSKSTVTPPLGSGTSLGPGSGGRVGGWQSVEEMNARRGPAQPLQNRGMQSAAVKASGPQHQYVAYFPPPPPRPVAREIEAPMRSPMPTRMTPTRRGEDLYLSVS
ncbi:hypothetical protein NA57DRAFT_51595 [Rhizodiscina lignyota]|uniref:CFEM domain-containing protein n=1 Tax=Rhizodiscina lignyota TaxID=1504668 RepID=A0A9P4IUQ7_9PEZI|nr:hypothetical protein NA57DRAFT_51595 [Rhizodiscina lignyota]